ncbi:MAG: hypothetical protein ACD_75C01028G0001 [uncultured bacterium]|nr:MAG: hypothetical protein ACD_75C01028G0001 [uncultured bacterium]
MVADSPGCKIFQEHSELFQFLLRIAGGKRCGWLRAEQIPAGGMQSLTVFAIKAVYPVDDRPPPHFPELLDKMQIIGELLQAVHYRLVYPFCGVMKMQQLRSTYIPGQSVPGLQGCRLRQIEWVLGQGQQLAIDLAFSQVLKSAHHFPPSLSITDIVRHRPLPERAMTLSFWHNRRCRIPPNRPQRY